MKKLDKKRTIVKKSEEENSTEDTRYGDWLKIISEWEFWKKGEWERPR